MDFDLPQAEVIAAPVNPEAAIAFWGWRATMPYDEAKKLADGAKDRAFYIACMTELGAVQTVKDALKDALENGETLADFKKRCLEVIESQGWHSHRIETIFRNNMQTAYAAGRYSKMQEVKKYRPFWQYAIVDDGRVRPSHAVLNNGVYPADHEFWEENYPPNGHACRCCVRTLSARQVENEGLTVLEKMPSGSMYTDPNTKMEYHVAKPGADNGWRNNPGKSWTEDLLRLSVEKIDANPELAAGMVRRFQGGFESWSKRPEGDFPLVALPSADVQKIGGKSVIGRLSAATWEKQQKHHPELTIKDYLTAQDAVEKGQQIQQDKHNLIYALDQPEGVVVVVKATRKGDELYVTSLWRMSEKARERGNVLRRLGNKEKK